MRGLTTSLGKLSLGLVLLAAWLSWSAGARASADTLAQAKDLYASAAYDEALAVLDRLQGNAPPSDTTSIAEYRVFCLLALDRRDEARKDIEGILHNNPQYVVSADQASPRIQGVFRDVRRESLPKIVMERYAVAKASFERKDPKAGPQFDDVLALLDDPDLQSAPALGDLRTVVSAFRDLTRAIESTQSAQSPAVQAPAMPSVERAAEPTPPADVIYTAADADVVPPVPRTQRIPPWMPTGTQRAQDFHGSVELLIDASGGVVSATIRASVHPAYNEQLLRAAREWKFTPARRQGMPVRYLKIVEIHLKPTTS